MSVLRFKNVSCRCAFVAAAFAFIILLLSSCSRPSSVYRNESETLRSQLLRKEIAETWSQELESSILTQKIEVPGGIERGMNVSPKVLAASRPDAETKPLYPEIEGFAVLDVSALPEQALSVLHSFCTAIKNASDADPYMVRSSIYSLFLFRTELMEYFGFTPVFASYTLGQPFISDTVCQCPVRFTRKNGKFIDVYVYLDRTSSWKVKSIEGMQQGDWLL